MSVFRYLIIFLAWILWLTRVVICFCYSTDLNIGLEPFNDKYEIVLLFVTLFLLVLVSKRNFPSSLLLFGINTVYFGFGIVKTIASFNNWIAYVQFSICILEIIIPLCILLNIVLGKDRKFEENVDKKTDWFFNNKGYDRKHDDRADENQYKF